MRKPKDQVWLVLALVTTIVSSVLWVTSEHAPAGTVWTFESADGAGGGNGRVHDDVGHTNASVAFAGQAHVFYSDTTTGTLRHAWGSGTRWSFEILDGAGGAWPG